MARTASDIMQTHLISVGPDTPLLSVHRLFVDEEINGAPVVDAEGRVQGVISSMDLLRAVAEERDSGSSASDYFRAELEFSSPSGATLSEDFQDQLGELTAADVMTRGGAMVSPDTPVSEVAKTLRTNRIHRVLVVEGETLRGIISSFDLMALVEQEPFAG